jgi:hypothetical protein
MIALLFVMPSKVGADEENFKEPILLWEREFGFLPLGICGK